MSTNANAIPKLVKPVPIMRRLIIYAILLPVFFLLGFVPMWLQSMETSRNLADTQRDLTLAQNQLNLAAIQRSLDSALIEAQQANYEPARLAASEFFTSLREETERGDVSALSSAQREAAKPLLAQQDSIITLLARGNVTSVRRLSEVYDSYLEIIK